MKKHVIRGILGGLGVFLLAAGIRQGEYAVTMNKAVRICLECIGIG
ncbi:MAG: CD1871A family CXXC motif-containing protein [Eubacteriales bacterium]|nr:CD1871A family CXXC motif-containing protein [Eubacteriales bacterium]